MGKRLNPPTDLQMHCGAASPGRGGHQHALLYPSPPSTHIQIPTGAEAASGHWLGEKSREERSRAGPCCQDSLIEKCDAG